MIIEDCDVGDIILLQKEERFWMYEVIDCNRAAKYVSVISVRNYLNKPEQGTLDDTTLKLYKNTRILCKGSA
jgi:hypothetical protein